MVNKRWVLKSPSYSNKTLKAYKDTAWNLRNLILMFFTTLHVQKTRQITTASRMSYLCSTNKKYCVSLWVFYVVGPQSGRDDVRPRGDEQPADCVGRRPSMCFVGDTLFTAVLIPMLGGYLLVDDTLASWANMLLLRRN